MLGQNAAVGGVRWQYAAKGQCGTGGQYPARGHCNVGGQYAAVGRYDAERMGMWDRPWAYGLHEVGRRDVYVAGGGSVAVKPKAEPIGCKWNSAIGGR